MPPPEAKPSTSNRPSVASTRIASSNASPPTGSTTTSTPRPSVCSRTAWAQPSVSGSTTSAPSDSTNSFAPVRCTIAITLAPIAFAIWMAAVPTPPAEPSTSTVSPGRSAPRRRQGEVHRVVVAQQAHRRAVVDAVGGRASRSPDGNATRSAHAPSMLKPVTRCPTLKPESAGAERTTPATSVPGTNGGSSLSWYSPLISSRSGKLTPAAPTSTTTMPSPATSSTSV